MEYIIAGSIICSLITAFNLLTSTTPFQRFVNQIFAAYLLVSGYCALLFILINTGVIEKIPHLFKTAAPFNFILPPIAYLYIRAVLKDETRFRKLDLLHFLPFLVFFISYIPFFILRADEKIYFIKKARINLSVQLGLIPEDIQFYVRALQTGVYTIVQWQLILKFNKYNIPSKLKVFSNQVFNWLKAVATMNALYFIGFIPLIIYSVFVDKHILYTQVFNVSLFIVCMAFFSITTYLLLNPIVLYGLDKRYSLTYSSPVQSNIKEQPLSINNFEREQKILMDYFDSSRPFLNHGLSLAEVSVAIDVPQRSISFIINSQMGIRFSDFVNQYRLKVALEEIENGYLYVYTLASLAEKVGFSSVKTMTRTFNKELGMTPTEYAATKR